MIHKLRFIAVAAFLVASGHAFADSSQQPGQSGTQPDLSLVPGFARPMYVDPAGKYRTPEQVKAAAFVDSLHLTQTAADAAGNPMMKQFANIQQRGAEQGDVALEKDRAAVLRFLGVDPASHQGQLYYFVSLSMPLPLLRAYEQEAMWDGGRLILKGIDPDAPDVRTFIAKELMPLVQFKGGSAEISIDPRLYDTYQVTTVPTIVYSEVPENQLCLNLTQQTVKDGDKRIQYQSCGNVADPDKYWKMEGTVTTTYALGAFADAGANVAWLQAALSKAAAAGVIPQAGTDKAQQGFNGDWQKAATPAELTSIAKAVNGVGGSGQLQTYMFPAGPGEFGLAKGPAGLSVKTQDGQEGLIPIKQGLDQAQGSP